jgi:hypothetical protein
MIRYAPDQQRVIDEKQSLDLKIDSLKDFINDDDQKIFDRLPEAEQLDLARQLAAMKAYSAHLTNRVARFGPPGYLPITKEELVAQVKQFRKDLDATLQQMKAFARSTQGCPFWADLDDGVDVLVQHQLAIHELEAAIMREGMTLKAIGNPNPYPSSYNPASPTVEPTADGLKL